MYENLRILLDRADSQLIEMKNEYDKCLALKTVSVEAIQLTHEVCEKLRSALDRICRRYFELRVAPDLSEYDRDRAKVYFPIVNDLHSFDSELGRWRWKSIREKHQTIYDYLLALQKFESQKNDWLAQLNELAVASKHIDLIPQKRLQQARTIVSREGFGSVSWGGGVRFGSGVSIMGAPVDPRTQIIIPTKGVEEKVEIWVSFLVSGLNIDPISFCRQSCRQVREIISELTEMFDL